MSRVGKKPIPVPSGVKIAVRDEQVVIEGPKGRLETQLPRGIRVGLANGQLAAQRAGDGKAERALHGLTRSLLANAVAGVTAGFQKELDVVGIGYRAEVRGKYLNLTLGFSHPIEFPIPSGISIRVEKAPRAVQNYVATLVVSGIDKQKVGQVAADLRALRSPDP
jgi:large subunit ribosomal protein L6